MLAELGVVPVLVMFIKAGWGGAIKRCSLAVGRMALSNYIMMALLCQHIYVLGACIGAMAAIWKIDLP